MSIDLRYSDSQFKLIKNGWFEENETLWKSQKFCIEVKKVLVNGKSMFQDILVFESKTYGNVLVLDGVIQATEKDEFSYQEMISHLPLFCHKNPKKVLIIGGGDGGVLREVAKHSCVEEIHMCEIDEQVVEVSKKYFKSMSCSFDDPRLILLHCDAIEYLKNEGSDKNYDVVICDSSDPIGPAKSLFEPDFISLISNSMSPFGILCSQCECIWLHMDLIKSVLNESKREFNNVKYAQTSAPTYPCGQIGFMLATKDVECNLSKPSRFVTEEPLKFYNLKMHEASFALPLFFEKELIN
jgi:spermidine synthase